MSDNTLSGPAPGDPAAPKVEQKGGAPKAGAPSGPDYKPPPSAPRQQKPKLPDNPPDTGSRPPVSATPDLSAAQQWAKNLAEAGHRLFHTGTADQREEMRRARDELKVEGSVAGDVFGGDSYTYNYTVFHGRDNAEFRAYRVTPEESAQPFVPPPGFDKLTVTVRSHRLVVIRGKTGRGKASALLQALTEILPDEAPIMRLEPGTDLTALSCERLPSGAAVVLYDLSGRDVAKLDSFTVERLTAELEQHDCRLGLTISDDVALRPASRLAVVELSTGPTPRQVFDKHLAALLVSAPAARAQLLDDPEVRKLLEEQFANPATLNQAAQLAEALSQAKDDPAPAATVRKRLNAHASEECVQWFRDLPGLRAHCMAIALAVLNGLPRETVSSAADRLETLIAPPPDLVGPSPVSNPFAPATGVTLSVLRAEATSSVTSAGTRAVPIMALRFEHAEYPGWVLQHVWREHDSARHAVVTWLSELGGHDNRSVRVRTATAVGVLGLDAFDFICGQIIGGWAQDEDPDVRDSAAIALGVPASDTRLEDTVRTLVQGWSTTGNGLLQATAARTYGESAGLARPSTSLRQLATLAEAKDIDVAIAVAISLGEMVMQGTAALAGRVLAEVDRWIRQSNRERRLVGRLAFLQMTYLRGAPTALGERPGSNESLPTLLLLAIGYPKLTDQLALLWADGLNSADVHRLVGDSLSAWARAVDPHPEARTRFVDLMRQNATDPRTGAILARAAVAWTRDPGSAPRTAECLLAKVTGVIAHG